MAKLQITVDNPGKKGCLSPFQNEQRAQDEWRMKGRRPGTEWLREDKSRQLPAQDLGPGEEVHANFPK
jgi:hypothetical protein